MKIKTNFLLPLGPKTGEIPACLPPGLVFAVHRTLNTNAFREKKFGPIEDSWRTSGTGEPFGYFGRGRDKLGNVEKTSHKFELRTVGTVWETLGYLWHYFWCLLSRFEFFWETSEKGRTFRKLKNNLRSIPENSYNIYVFFFSQIQNKSRTW